MPAINRRQFLGAAAFGAAALSSTPGCAPGSASSSSSDSPPGRTVSLGLIGCGWWGMVNVKAAFSAGGARVAAVCDVDSEHLEKTAAEIETLQGSRPRTFKHYEEMLAAPGLEAVIIATPPQWHALPFIAAIERGLDIYCEKPLAYDVREGRAMVDAAAKSDRVVQIGFQRHRSAAFKQVREFIAAGHLGRVVQAEAQINFTASLVSAAPQPPPDSLDWDLWCGPGPLLPYSPQVGHRHWRLVKAVGQGHLYDWGIHYIDAARMILDLDAPRAVTAAGGLYGLGDGIDTPDTLVAHFDFERCPLTWRHRMWGAKEFAPEADRGIFFYGENGTVFATENAWTVIPPGKNAQREVHEAKSETHAPHFAEFLDAVRERKPVSSTIANAHLSTTAVKLAMISYETGSRLEWNSETEEITGNPAAAQLLKRDYRAPWKHPHTG